MPYHWRLWIEDFLWWVAGKKLAGRCLCVYICPSVSLSVCPSIFTSGAETARPIKTGEYSFDEPERRKDDGTGFRSICCTWHVPHAIPKTLAQNCSPGCRPNQRTDSSQVWWADSHHGWTQSVWVDTYVSKCISDWTNPYGNRYLGPIRGPRKAKRDRICAPVPRNGNELYAVACHSKELDFPDKIQPSDTL